MITEAIYGNKSKYKCEMVTELPNDRIVVAFYIQDTEFFLVKECAEDNNRVCLISIDTIDDNNLKFFDKNELLNSENYKIFFLDTIADFGKLEG